MLNMRTNAQIKFLYILSPVNIKIASIPAESPWCNGICERHNATLKELLLKVKEDINCPWETALAWAVNAKNSFINVSGFSLHQLVFGKNIYLPSSLNDQLSAEYSENPLVLEHLNALYSLPQAFMKIESSNKLRHTLRKQTRKTRESLTLSKKYITNAIVIRNGKGLAKL